MDSDMLELSVVKRMRDFNVDIALQVSRGVSVLLGPSGHGKTTLLNMISGITCPDKGTIQLNDVTLFNSQGGINLPMEKRRVGFVFQDFALFPHMTVFQNVAYGLSALGSRGKELENRVRSELERLEISSLAKAKPAELSAGQRQRAALARTLAIAPKILLLDEPLSALDMRLRAKVRGELRQLLSSLDIPTIMVTHDPLDAVCMADRVVVMETGRVVQVGTYEDLLSRPRTSFVADFVESNAFPAQLIRWAPSDESVVRINDRVQFRLPLEARLDRMMVVVHPWDITIAKTAEENSMQNAFSGVVRTISNLRDRARLLLDIGVPIAAEIGRSSITKLDLRVGDAVVASFKATAVRAVPVCE